MLQRIDRSIVSALLMLVLLCTVQIVEAETERRPTVSTVKVHAVVGTLLMKKGNNAVPVREGAILELPVTLFTNKHSQAALKVGNHTLISINRASVVSLRRGAFQLALKFGELWFEALSSSSAVQLTLPAGRLLARGARFNVQIRRSGGVVDLLSGTLDLSRGNKRLTLAPGQRGLLSSGKLERLPSPDLAALTQWTESLTPPKKEDKKEPTDSGMGTLLARIPGTKISKPLRLKRHIVRVTVRGSLVRTEIEEVFENPSDRQLEGVYYFPLPPGASISRLAMEINGALVEGAIEEHKRARRIYEDIVRKMQDPALLEWAGGNSFKMRIFPIPKRGTKRLILAYTQQLNARNGRYRYVYPMESTNKRVGKFGFSMTIVADRPLLNVESPLYPAKVDKLNRKATVSFTKLEFAPRGDFVVTFSTPTARGVTVSRYVGDRKKDAKANYLMLRLNPEIPRPTIDSTARDVLIMVDTSASNKPSTAKIQRKLLRALLQSLPADVKFNLLHFDYSARSFKTELIKASRSNRQAALRWISAVKPGGATNIKGAFDLAATLLANARNPRVYLISDGVASMDQVDETALLAHARKQLPKTAQIFPIAVGNSFNDLLLTELSRQHNGRFFTIGAGDALNRRVVEILSARHTPLLTGLKLVLPAELEFDRYPKLVRNLRRGDDLLLIARTPKPLPANLVLKLQGTLVNGTRRAPFSQRLTIQTASAEKNPFVPRLWAQKRIRTLMLDGGKANRKEIVTLSKAYGIMTRFTAFLVLDSKKAFKRHNLKQQKLDDKRKEYFDNDKDGLMDVKRLEPRKPGYLPPMMKRIAVLKPQRQRYMRLMKVTKKKKGKYGRKWHRRRREFYLRWRAWRDQLRKRARACMTDPDVSGRLVVRWLFTEKNRITDVSVSGTPTDPKLQACVKKAVERSPRWTRPLGRQWRARVRIAIDPNQGSRAIIGVLSKRLKSGSAAAKRKALTQLITIWINQKRYDTATRKIAVFKRRWKAEPLLLLLESRVLRAQNQIEAANRLLTRYYTARIVKEPNSFTLRHRLCGVLLVQKRYPEALAAARGWIERSPKDPRPQFWSSKALRKLGRAEQADDAEIKGYYLRLKVRSLNNGGRRAFYRLLTRRNRDSERVELTLKIGSVAEVARLLKPASDRPGVERSAALVGRAIRYRPLERKLRKFLVEFYLKHKAYRDALNAAIAWKVNDRENVNLLRQIGDLQLRLGSEAKALRVYSEMVEFRPKEAEGHRKLALILKSRGKLKAAYSHMTTALEIRPKQPWIHFALGDLAAKLGRLDEAERRFRTVVSGKWPSRYSSVVYPAKDRLAMVYMQLRKDAQTRGQSDRVRRISDKIRALGIDKFLKNEIRISMYWDTDNTDVDLWVIDPAGEKVYYSHKKSKIGGRLYADITSGYGPELFTLKRAIKGTYKVIVHYYGGSNSGEESRGEVQVVLFPGTKRQSIKSVPYLLKKRKDKKSVVTFTIR